jgi:hypothetical protein
MDEPARQVVPSLGELIDRLTIDQIKELQDPALAASCGEEIARIERDLDAIFQSQGVPLTAELLRLVIALAQMNLHIWKTKDVMLACPERFQASMKLAHQLNGLRNQLKNRLLALVAGTPEGAQKTNCGTDQLEGWDLSVLHRGPGAK